jgi:hypothetical protein
MIVPALALVAIYALATTVGPTSDTSTNDLYVYSVYADLLRHGQLPFHDFAFEYPPLALAPIALGGHPLPLALAMLACLLVTQWCCWRLAGRSAAWVVAISPLLTGALVRTHFDALSAALAAAALLAFARARPRWGFALLALGGMVKAWPLVLVPVAAVWLVARGDRRAAVHGVAVAAAICVVVLAPFAGGGLIDAVRFHRDRPVQIESTPASVLLVTGGSFVTGDPVRPDPYKSNGLAGGGAGAVEAVFGVALIVALAGAVALATRSPDVRRLALCCFLAVLAFVSLGKVLSPQYLVWLVPFAAVAWAWGARVPAALTLAATALTQLEFPSRYFDLVDRDGAAVAIVATRNALLVAAGVSLAAGLARSRRPAAAVTPAPARP